MTAINVNHSRSRAFQQLPLPLGEDTKRYQLADYAQLVRGSALSKGHLPRQSRRRTSQWGEGRAAAQGGLSRSQEVVLLVSAKALRPFNCLQGWRSAHALRTIIFGKILKIPEISIQK